MSWVISTSCCSCYPAGFEDPWVARTPYLILAAPARCTLGTGACFVLLWMPRFVLRCHDRLSLGETRGKLFQALCWTQGSHRAQSCKWWGPSRAGRRNTLQTCNAAVLGARHPAWSQQTALEKCTASAESLVTQGGCQYSERAPSSFSAQPCWSELRQQRGEVVVHSVPPCHTARGEARPSGCRCSVLLPLLVVWGIKGRWYSALAPLFLAFLSENEPFRVNSVQFLRTNLLLP